jgi:hypothetical protein
MSKIWTVAGVAVAVATLAMTAADAFAVEGIWLVNGALAASEVASDTEAELQIDILNNAKTMLLFELLCSVILDGTVGPDGKDEITAVLSLGNFTAGNLGGTGVNCEVMEPLPLICDSVSKIATIWPDNLPWPSSLINTGTKFEDDEGAVNKEPGFDFECENSAAGKLSSLCEGQLISEVETTGEGDVFGTLIPGNEQTCTAFLGETPLADVTGTGLVLLTAGGTLAVS